MAGASGRSGGWLCRPNIPTATMCRGTATAAASCCMRCRRRAGDDAARTLDGAARSRDVIPAGTEHSVEMLGDVSMRSVYVMPRAIPGLPEGFARVGVTDLMHSLIVGIGKAAARRRAGRARRTDHEAFAT